ncbi:4452_t:CDS:2 [Entrophospora sp. SA101]|nr:4452_t:CDS:2 [Entrophospora sp. SA101]
MSGNNQFIDLTVESSTLSSGSGPSTNINNINGTSDVWIFFNKINNGKAQCYYEKMKQTTLKLNQVIPYSTTSQEYKLITDKLVNWIAMDTLPFTIVESPAFHELISSLNEKKISQAKNVKYLAPILDCPTCWNSTYLMLERQIETKEINQRLVRNNPSSIELEYLTENDWKQIDDLCVILKPLYIATKFLSSSSPTLSDVCITFTALIKELKKVIDGNNEHYLIADSVNHKLKEYWSLMENNTRISSVIDPRNKLSGFTLQEIEELKNEFKNLIDTYEPLNQQFNHHTQSSTQDELEQMDNDKIILDVVEETSTPDENIEGDEELNWTAVWTEPLVFYGPFSKLTVWSDFK